MHIITQKRINDAKAVYPETATALDHWYKTMKLGKYRDFSELRLSFASVDKVGKLFVFDIGGNKLRLIAAIHFNTGKVFIRHIFSHAEYDQNLWKKQEGL
ncbi:MAG: type II toxin-antitoxin system HigB family toxin [Methylococcales bacterium]|nr:MAG: type II toxin-antitoxin system HigB family toxin [Methylococcales bacterium]